MQIYLYICDSFYSIHVDMSSILYFYHVSSEWILQTVHKHLLGGALMQKRALKNYDPSKGSP